MKTKMNDYQKFYAIKKAFKNGSLEYNGKVITEIYPKSIMVFAGVSRLEILLKDETETIFVDIQDIKIN
jgi:hypothetical protein